MSTEQNNPTTITNANFLPECTTVPILIKNAKEAKEHKEAIAFLDMAESIANNDDEKRNVAKAKNEVDASFHVVLKTTIYGTRVETSVHHDLVIAGDSIAHANKVVKDSGLEDIHKEARNEAKHERNRARDIAARALRESYKAKQDNIANGKSRWDSHCEFKAKERFILRARQTVR